MRTQEIDDFMRNPERFNAIARVFPRAFCLLALRSRKTLLAKAVAERPRFRFSRFRSDFVEMFVGERFACARSFHTAKRAHRVVVYRRDRRGRPPSRRRHGRLGTRARADAQPVLVEMDCFSPTRDHRDCWRQTPEHPRSGVAASLRFDRQITVNLSGCKGPRGNRRALGQQPLAKEVYLA